MAPLKEKNRTSSKLNFCNKTKKNLPCKSQQRNRGPNHQYSDDQLSRALAEIRENSIPVATASKLFGIPRTTLRDKLAGKTTDKIEKVGPECVLGTEVEVQLVNWITGNAAN